MRSCGMRTVPQSPRERHGLVVGVHELALEVLAPLDRLARAHADAAAEEAPVVVELGQRPLGPGRGDLDRVVGEQVAQMVRVTRAQSARSTPPGRSRKIRSTGERAEPASSTASTSTSGSNRGQARLDARLQRGVRRWPEWLGAHCHFVWL